MNHGKALQLTRRELRAVPDPAVLLMSLATVTASTLALVDAPFEVVLERLRSELAGAIEGG